MMVLALILTLISPIFAQPLLDPEFIVCSSSFELNLVSDQGQKPLKAGNHRIPYKEAAIIELWMDKVKVGKVYPHNGIYWLKPKDAKGKIKGTTDNHSQFEVFFTDPNKKTNRIQCRFQNY